MMNSARRIARRLSLLCAAAAVSAAVHAQAPSATAGTPAPDEAAAPVTAERAAAPLTAEDRLEIMGLIARYEHQLDSGDLDGYVANFLPDAVIDWGNGRAEGREGIRSWVEGMLDDGIGADPPQWRHFVGLPSITGDGERASALTYIVLFGKDDADGVTVPYVGSYSDTLVKVDGRWRFERRDVRLDLR